MINKYKTLEHAILAIEDSSIIMVGGFGSPGTPFTLISALKEHGVKDLTLIKNDANEQGIGISELIENGQVKCLITSHLGLNRLAIEKMTSGELDVEFVPQGILAERIRCAGVGLPGFVSQIGLDTEIALDAKVIEIDNQSYKFEPAIKADHALIHCAQSDVFGNLRYRATAMNFNPLMAMAGNNVIVESFENNPIEPNQVQTPGIFVDHLIDISKRQGHADYQLIEHHVHV